MNSRRLPLLSALLAVFLVAGCGASTKTTSPGAPSTSSTVGSGTTDSSTPDSSTPGAGTATASAAPEDNAPIDATCPATNTTTVAKTKFLAHAGLAFGAFHRYLYKPYQAGAYKPGQKGRIVALAKAGASALFIKREIRLMSADAKSNPTRDAGRRRRVDAIVGRRSPAIEDQRDLSHVRRSRHRAQLPGRHPWTLDILRQAAGIRRARHLRSEESSVPDTVSTSAPAALQAYCRALTAGARASGGGQGLRMLLSITKGDR